LKKVGVLLLIILVISGVATWFLLLNINSFTDINLFGYEIKGISSGALTLVSFILGGLVVWLISFIAHSVEVSHLRTELAQTKKEKSLSNKARRKSSCRKERCTKTVNQSST